ncbi:MAG: hypothetical protein FJW30_07840 [Acidobacteria bacterium]|nr:hypothetical protein [Acidobacteriota bacterium]
MTLLFAVFAATVSFQGNWILDAKASTFGNFPAPSAMTQEVTQTAAEIRLKQTLGKNTVRDYVFPLDGRTVTAERSGNSWATTASWEGEMLHVRQQSSFGITFLERWTLSDGGKTLTVKRTMEGEKGTMVMVFRKN